MLKILISSILFLTAFSSLAEARRDQKREAIQQGRIAGGVKSGELTAKEAVHLRKGQKRVDRAQRRAKADGEVTNAEQLKLENMQDRQNTKIYNQKHDEQKRDSAKSPEVETPESGE